MLKEVIEREAEVDTEVRLDSIPPHGRRVLRRVCESAVEDDLGS